MDRAAPGPPRATLVIVCGLPGSGKTTAATRLARERGAVRLCADEWMQQLRMSLWDVEAREGVEQLQHGLALELLEVRCSVVVEWGTWARSQRDGLREDARARGALVELHFLDAPDDELWRRIATRGRERPAITREQIGTWRELFEVPTEAELASYDVAHPPVRPTPS
ncbi:AAA family ATPase [Ornithinimicrobium cerasi]|uniref:AAA family ATPase n=1 Tax=Ornithinimicrobium cerasi TaxID=2248773 RepID=UPI000F00FA7E|nr:ATP-binding protein [Ornithinimicrobium cerasi]